MSELTDDDYEAALAEEAATPICPRTGMYCTGEFCDEYGCAKQAGFYDDETD